jgi:hypothetical protein
MMTKIIVPILNKSVSTYKGPIWYLSEGVCIETISADDYYIISNSSLRYKTLLTTKSKCVRINNVDPKYGEVVSRVESSKIAYILNCFRRTNPAAVSFAAQITQKRKAKLDKIIDLSVISDAYLQKRTSYQIRADLRKDHISEFYKIVSAVHTKEPGILLTLDRFNSALVRQEDLDKIIDITISLESLINGTTELRHRFSLFNSWAAEGDSKQRKETCELLQLLYDARSTIVHGTSLSEREYRKKIDPVLSQWDSIIKLAERCIGYHLFYVYQNDAGSWYQHQQNLVLGLEERII